MSDCDFYDKNILFVLISFMLYLVIFLFYSCIEQNNNILIILDCSKCVNNTWLDQINFLFQFFSIKIMIQIIQIIYK